MLTRFQSAALRRASTTVVVACALLAGEARLEAQSSQLPSTPADQQQNQQNGKTTPPTDQQQQPSPESPTPQSQSVPGKVVVPKAVPSMMPKEPGTMIDRVVAIVNGQVVLDSDVEEEHRFEQIQPYPNAVGNQPTREREIERLVNRDLILQQAKLETQETISDADVDKEVADLRKTLPGCKPDLCATDAGWAHYLSQHGFSAEEFRTRWMQRMQVLAFIQERFGAGTSVTEGQVREFYQNTMLPQYKKAGAKPAPFASVEPRIREILQQQQVSNLLRDWLQSLRAQGSITVLHPGEEAP
jgi:peptidyl-prolyl cis-trans isomerase SurA